MPGDAQVYRIGATICLTISDVLPLVFNNPMRTVELTCPSIPENAELNIPPDIPRPTRIWTHTSLDRTKSAVAIIQVDDVGRTQEFVDTFPLITGAGQVSFPTSAPAHSIIFNIFNVTRDPDPNNLMYEELQQAFGTWTCTLNNSLGEVTRSTFISDMCEYTFVFSDVWVCFLVILFFLMCEYKLIFTQVASGFQVLFACLVCQVFQDSQIFF